MLQLVEEVFDEIALSLDRRIDRALDLAIATGRNVSAAAAIAHQFDQRFRIIPAIGNKVAAGFERFDQHGRDGLVRRLALRQDDAHRQAGLVDDGIDLGAQSSTRTADGVIRAPFFPPAACW